MVPVIRNANLMSIPELETEIQKVAEEHGSISFP
jgi:pyruvate/2-oxoglutarate dehydrogenase complex dihydrolipoamide acyltransferase (E2) component